MTQTQIVSDKFAPASPNSANLPVVEQTGNSLLTSLPSVTSSSQLAQKVKRLPNKLARQQFIDSPNLSNSQRHQLVRQLQSPSSSQTKESPQAGKPDGEHIVTSQIPGARPAAPEDFNFGPNHAAFRQKHQNDGKENFIEGQAFVQQPGDANPISATDVNQGQLGDCWVIAGLGSLANTKRGRGIIYKMIKEIWQGGRVVAYDVTFPAVSGGWLGWGGHGQRTIRVESSFIGFGKPDNYNFSYAKGNLPPVGNHQQKTELWVAVLEKAYAELRGGYDVLDNGGFASDAMTDFTGQKSQFYNKRDGSFPPDPATLQQFFNQDAAISVGTHHNPKGDSEEAAEFEIGNGRELSWEHEYIVTKVWGNGGHLQLRNPNGGSVEITFEELHKYFMDMSVNSGSGKP